MSMQPLPIDDVLPDIVGALRRHSSVVVHAPTGAGKTTRVPSAILDAGMAGEGLIVMLEPRRLAAQTAARRMANEHQQAIGQTFGYHIRFDRRVSPATQVLVVTEGVFLRMLLADPLLEKVAVVLFDEFHERSVNSDLALAVSLRLQTELRPDLKLVVMSATLDPKPIAQYLGCPVVASEGRHHPVELRFLPLPSKEPVSRLAASGVRELADVTRGDILVFLPGIAEIRRTHDQLDPWAADRNLAIFELYGELPMDAQDEVLRPADRRKVILSTNVAETSVTIEGVTAVVDSGLARILRCDDTVGINRLTVERISRASADQRAGRAGRTAPGTCLRLWTEHEHRFLAERDSAEILRVDLSGPRLTLLSWGESELENFPWFEPPRPAAWDQAATLLRRLGATDRDGLTEIGRKLALLPVHPRIARLLLEGNAKGCESSAAIAAALLSERDPFRSDKRRADYVSASDLLDRVQALEAFESSGTIDSMVGELNPGAARYVLRVKSQLLRTLRDADVRGSKESFAEDKFLRCVLAAFPDRIARRRQVNSRRGIMVGGRGVLLSERSAVQRDPFFACVDLEEVGGNEAVVRQASRIEPSWLPSDFISEDTEVTFDSERQRVVMNQRLRYEDLVLEETQVDRADEMTVARVLCEAATNQLERAIALDDEKVVQFLSRVRSLRQWMPQWNLPEFSHEELCALLPAMCAGRRSFAELRAAPLLDRLRSTLTHQQLTALDREAPERMSAASGSQIRLLYEPGRPPVMAVRIQEMFGQSETPRVASGRVAVLLHLLAPSMRPQQITDDLRGFWERVYPQIRKELRRRYPKHAWPDDPLTAAPERRPQRKSRN